MKYNLSEAIGRERFKRRCNELYKKGCVVELTKKTQRTLNQNAYLYVILSYLAMETGNTVEYVKREFFKIECNKALFVTTDIDKILNKEVLKIRSSSDLTTVEMTTAIERFRNWSADNGYYLPSPEEQAFLQEIEIELDKQKQYL